MKRRGHNLLEVSVAAFIFSTVMIVMIGIWAVYHSALSKSRNLLVATSLARSVLEQRVAAGYKALDTQVGQPPVHTTFLARSQVRGRPIVVEYSVDFQAVDSATEVGFRRLTVDLKWREDSGDKTLSYETFLYRTQ